MRTLGVRLLFSCLHSRICVTADGVLAIPRERDAVNSSPTLPKDTGTAEAPLETLDQVLDYFEEDSDVSKFVALARLRAILDNKLELREDPQVIARCWAAVPARFLDRLLGAANYKADKSVKDRTVLDRRIIDRDYMIGYAVATIHLFMNLLPEASRDDKKFARRIGGLLHALTIRYIEVFLYRTCRAVRLISRLVHHYHLTRNFRSCKCC